MGLISSNFWRDTLKLNTVTSNVVPKNKPKNKFLNYEEKLEEVYDKFNHP
jgi:hypothetical protein